MKMKMRMKKIENEKENENDKTLITIKKLNDDLDAIIDKSKSFERTNKIDKKSRKDN